MDGMTMMKKLREKNLWGKQVPIIILTNLTAAEVIKLQIIYMPRKNNSQKIQSKQKTSKKIFLIEDEKILAEMYQTKFEHEGFQVLTLDNGAGALEVAKKEKPALILLDIILPKTDGFSVLEQLKKDDETKKIPVVMLTNLGQDEDIKKGKRLGADDYIVKANSTPALVVERVKKYI